jgi:hypothetical protein
MYPLEHTNHDSNSTDRYMMNGRMYNLVINQIPTIVAKHTDVVAFHFKKLASLDKSTGMSDMSCTKNTIDPTRVKRQKDDPMTSRLVTT